MQFSMLLLWTRRFGTSSSFAGNHTHSPLSVTHTHSRAHTPHSLRGRRRQAKRDGRARAPRARLRPLLAHLAQAWRREPAPCPDQGLLPPPYGSANQGVVLFSTADSGANALLKAAEDVPLGPGQSLSHPRPNVAATQRSLSLALARVLNVSHGFYLPPTRKIISGVGKEKVGCAACNLKTALFPRCSLFRPLPRI